MRLNPILMALFCIGAAGVSDSRAAASADITFVGEARYTDAGVKVHERRENLEKLGAHLRQLAGRHLSDGQTLSIEVLDVDLAGISRPWRSTGEDLRVLRGGADTPRIELRYTLRSNGATQRSGEESITDLGYQQHVNLTRQDEPLGHEKRMLGDWFRARFIEGRSPD